MRLAARSAGPRNVEVSGIARAHGFTLVEVLVALIIVALGMSALMSALSSSASSVSYMRDKTLAEWVALNQIATFRLQLTQGQIPAVATTNGDIDEYAGRSWHWRQDIVATPVQGMMRIDVKVRPKEVKAGDDDGWYVTVSGLTGDALAAPGTTMISWDTTTNGNGPNGNGPNGNGPNGNGPNGLNTNTTTTPLTPGTNPGLPLNPNTGTPNNNGIVTPNQGGATYPNAPGGTTPQ